MHRLTIDSTIHRSQECKRKGTASLTRDFPSDGRCGTGSHRPCNHGFTLIEVMVAVAISAIVIASVYSTFTSQYQSSIAQAQVSEMQQNARLAMDLISRDLITAGFGKPATAVNGFSNAVAAANNGTNGADGITVVSAYRQLSTLAADASRGATTITVQSSADAAQFDTGTRRYLYLDGISAKDNYVVSNVGGTQLTVSPALTRDYVAGSPVFLVKAITYSLDFADADRPILRRNENIGAGAQVVSPFIEDLQFAYQDLNGGWFNVPPVAAEVRAIRINILGRTSREDPEWSRASLGRRPAIEDHAAAGAPDGFKRRLLTTVVEVRNMGL